MDVNHILNHWDDGIAYVAVGWTIAAAISTMPKPLSDERWYGWIFNFLQLIAANLKEIKSSETRLDSKEVKAAKVEAKE